MQAMSVTEGSEPTFIARYFSALNGCINRFSIFGLNVVLFYLVFSYFLPALHYSIFHEYLVIPVKKVPIGGYGILYLAAVVTLMILADRLGWADRLGRLHWPSPVRRSLSWAWAIYDPLRLVLGGLFLAASTYFVLQGLSGYRYSAEGFAGVASLLVFGMLFFKSWALADLLVQSLKLTSSGERQGRSGLWRVASILVAASLTISIDGLASSVIAAIYCYMAFFPLIYSRYLLLNFEFGGNGGTTKRIGLHVLAVLGLFVVMLVTWQVGDRVKHINLYLRMEAADPSPPGSILAAESPDEVIVNILERFGIHSEWLVEHTKRTLIWLPERLSIEYYSFTNITDQAWNNEYSPALGWRVIGENLVYRFGTLVGISSKEERPVIRSIAQMNYYKMLPLKFTNNRSGSSPGALGSFTYLLPQPLDIVGGVGYLLLLATLLSRALASSGVRYSIVGYLIIFALTRGLFLNPADYLLILNGGFIFFVIFLLLVEARFAASASEKAIGAGKPAVSRP